MQIFKFDYKVVSHHYIKSYEYSILIVWDLVFPTVMMSQIEISQKVNSLPNWNFIKKNYIGI